MKTIPPPRVQSLLPFSKNNPIITPKSADIICAAVAYNPVAYNVFSGPIKEQIFIISSIITDNCINDVEATKEHRVHSTYKFKK